ncbi:MAG TPA: SDR family NAD(P)-dependent oxidoreductase [Candidatus Acidoferrales bacterium]
MKYFLLNVADASSIRDLASSVARDFPSLNCLINNAGVQHRGLNFAAGSFDDAAMANEVQTNLIGLICMCAAFIPQLRGKEAATLVNVSSGLAFVPRAFIPIYCATKAAVHSFTLSLRWQLRDERIQVVELIPPWVKTDLGGFSPVPLRPSETSSAAAQPVQPMPLAEFTQAAIQGLLGGADEVTAGHAAGLASAGGLEAEKALFARMNS